MNPSQLRPSCGLKRERATRRLNLGFFLADALMSGIGPMQQWLHKPLSFEKAYMQLPLQNKLLQVKLQDGRT